MRFYHLEAHPGNTGYWSPVTSTLDWCELNYQHSSFIAESFNSFSNIPYIVFGLIGIYSVVSTNSEKRFIYPNIGLCLVGLGSFLFHATLRYYTQLSDELPMIYCTAIFNYCLTQSFPPYYNKTLQIIGYLLYSGIATILYVTYRNPLIHEVSYGILALITFVVPVYQINRLNQMGYNKETYNDLTTLYLSGSLSYISGFIVWNIENWNCLYIRSIQDYFGYPIAFLFQMHVWWHLGTSYGSYVSCVLSLYIRSLALKRRDIGIRYYFIFPVVVLMKNDRHFIKNA